MNIGLLIGGPFGGQFASILTDEPHLYVSLDPSPEGEITEAAHYTRDREPESLGGGISYTGSVWTFVETIVKPTSLTIQMERTIDG